MNRLAGPSSTRIMYALAGVLCAARATPCSAQSPSARMAPVGQYLMADAQAEIALARTAAPSGISAHAKVLVLTRHGYVQAVAGTNGFVCLVERAWESPFGSPNFWNPKIRGPDCYNPAGVRSVLPILLRRTALALAGRTEQEILDSLRAGPHRAAAPGAMSYMLSKEGHIGDGAGPWHPHLMLFEPAADSGSWGAKVRGSPVLAGGSYVAEGDPIYIFLIPVAKWSDGTVDLTQR